MREVDRVARPRKEAYGLRGLIYAKKGEVDKAIADCAVAIDARKDPLPHADRPYYGRGLAQLHRGDFEKAASNITRAIDLASECYSDYPKYKENYPMFLARAARIRDKATPARPWPTARKPYHWFRSGPRAIGSAGDCMKRRAKKRMPKPILPRPSAWRE